MPSIQPYAGSNTRPFDDGCHENSGQPNQLCCLFVVLKIDFELRLVKPSWAKQGGRIKTNDPVSICTLSLLGVCVLVIPHHDMLSKTPLLH